MGEYCAGILNNLWGLGSKKELSYRTGPPGYIGWGAQDMQVVFAKSAAILDHTFLLLKSHMYLACQTGFELQKLKENTRLYFVQSFD